MSDNPLFDLLPEPAQPGDLIRAQDLNLLVDFLLNLEARVSDLEGRDRNPVISHIIPAGPLRIGDTIEIIGHNFAFSLGAHRVYFDRSRVRVYDNEESSDTRLVLEVPNVPGVVEAGTRVLVTVGNQIAVDTTEVTLKPEIVEQEGNLSLSHEGTEPVELEAGGSIDFLYELSSFAFLPANATIEASISIPDWQDRLVLLDSEDEPLDDGQIALEPGETAAFKVHMDEIPPGSTGTIFTLTVKASAPGLPDATDQRPFEVGEPAPQPDQAVETFDFNAANPPAAVVDGSNILLEDGATASVQMRGEFFGPAPGEDPQVFVFSVEVVQEGDAWTAVTPSSFIPFAGPVEFTVDAPTSQFVAFDVSRDGAAESATLVCKLTRVLGGETLETTDQFTLEPI